MSGESQPWFLGFDVKEGITFVGSYGEQELLQKPRGLLTLSPEESGKVSYWEVTTEQGQRGRWHLATGGGAKRGGACK